MYDFEPNDMQNIQELQKHLNQTIFKIVEITFLDSDLKNKLDNCCSVIREALGDSFYVRIHTEDGYFTSNPFYEGEYKITVPFDLPGPTIPKFEIYYTKKISSSLENTYFKFLQKASQVISGEVSKHRLVLLSHEKAERDKELRGIYRTTDALKNMAHIEEAMQNICEFLPEAWQYPQDAVARIVYNNKVFVSRRFKETEWVQKQVFNTPDNKEGSIEVFYLQEFPKSYEGPFLKEERSLIDNLAALISGMATKSSLEHLLLENTERLKELRSINQTSAIIASHNDIALNLQEICNILPEAYQYPEHTVVRISYENLVFTSKNFKETSWLQKQEFESADQKHGLIEVYYTRKYPDAFEGPFLEEERNLLINIANLISGSATKMVFNKLLNDNKERLKELNLINQTTSLMAKGEIVEECLGKICALIPKSWQYPEHTVARITYEDKIYASVNFKETVWVQKESFVTIDNKKGAIEVYYLTELPEAFEGPFLKEERQLLINLGKLVCGYLNNFKGREIYRKSLVKEIGGHNSEEYRKSLVRNKQPLQLFFNKQILDKYIYLDMMRYKVKDILFVATLYDAFILENEDNFFEQFMGEIYQYSLFSLPRITGVTSPEEALELLQTTSFDLVILMVGMDAETPIELSKKIRSKVECTPIYLLLNQKSNIKYFEELVPKINSVDKVFVWNGNSQIIFAIVKSIEDSANVENDTKIGLVRIILVIEDSAQYYSKYLQIIYSIVFGQIQQILPEVEKNEINKISKMRSRPKVLLARNYEDAMYIYNRYKDYLLCVISDVEFDREGKLDKTAGIRFIKYVRSHFKNLPILLQSANAHNKKVAANLGIGYINKNSERLLNDLRKFLTYHLRFGDFVFRDKDGKQIAVAQSVKEFEQILREIPEESLYLHGIDNQFSLWLMSRGEIKLAKTLYPVKVTDFPNLHEFRQFFIKTLYEHRIDQKRGKILSFDEATTFDEKNIISFAGGSFGGKGRGLAFINTLIYNLDFSTFSKEIDICTPITVIIGTDEFELFMENNQLHDKIFGLGHTYEQIKQLFLDGQLSGPLIKKLEVFLTQIKKPIAVRSSSLSEDSINQPFAGVFDTYIVPNNQDSLQKNLAHLMAAIKLVFASTFSDNARAYFKAIHHKIEEERMAVVLQELVGSHYGDYYYPHISGTAQSYNYYPVAHMKPEEGFALAAVGLGYYVVGGGKSYRFSPKYPKIEIFTNKDLLSSTQVNFLAVDLSKKDVDFKNEGEAAPLVSLDIEVAEKHGTLKHCASVYNFDNDSIETGLSAPGPRIINFGNILKYGYIPLAPLLEELLNTTKDALGSPVEMEYAVDLNPDKGKPAFYLLQIKPLVSHNASVEVDLEKLNKEDVLLYTHSSVGNGEVDDIHDVIYVDPELFDKMKTLEMAREIEHLNNMMAKHGKKYVLIGPGRWGTRDQFLGIPILWPQISNARVIVEMSLDNFPLDGSLGSHFFHNVSSMNIGYFTIQSKSLIDFIRWDFFKEQKVVHQTKHFKHVHFQKALKILMNGKQNNSAILVNH